MENKKQTDELAKLIDEIRLQVNIKIHELKVERDTALVQYYKKIQSDPNYLLYNPDETTIADNLSIRISRLQGTLSDLDKVDYVTKNLSLIESGILQ